MLFDEHALVEDDPEHSEAEDGLLILGLSSALRFLLVVCSEPLRDEVRIISPQG